MNIKVDPADWAKIEADYRAGIKSLRLIAGEHALTEGAIRKRAKRDDWSRDLAAKIAAKTEQLVRDEAVRELVRDAHRVPEIEVIRTNAEMQATAIMASRREIQRHITLSGKLIAELEAQTDDPELFAQLAELMAAPDEKGLDRLNEAYKKVISLPGRVDSAKKLSEILKTLTGLKRQALGIADSADGDNTARQKPTTENNSLTREGLIAELEARGLPTTIFGTA